MKIKNIYLRIRMYVLSKFKKYGSDEPKHLKSVYEASSYDDFINSDNWKSGFPWGEYNPKHTYQYWHRGEISHNKLIYKINQNNIVLDAIYNPKTFKTETGEITIPYEVTVIEGQTGYKRGFFRFNIALPDGPGLWPAVWLTGKYHWPPEIDLLESYSNKNGIYKHESNIHIGDKPINHEMVGAEGHIVNNEYNLTVGCWYEPDKFIKIYYDGYLVREITDQNVLKWFQLNPEMVMVINTAVRPEYVANRDAYQVGELVIKKIEVFA